MDGVEIVDRRFATFILDNAPLEKLAEGFRWLEGPVWFGDMRTLLFNDLPNNRTMQWSEHTGVSVFRRPSWFANGQTRDRDGRLISCSHQRRCVIRTEHDGALTVIADRFEGKKLNSPNDVVVKSDGSVWFTDPWYGIQTDYEGGKAEPELPCRVYRIDAAMGALSIVADEFLGPNGLCFSPDESLLYIAETGELFATDPAREIRVFQVESGGERLSKGRVFHKVSPGFADGFRCDEDGNIWSSAEDGVHCLSPSGDLMGKVRTPLRVANLTFGGRGNSRLFICASQALYAIYLNRRGAR